MVDSKSKMGQVGTKVKRKREEENKTPNGG